MRKEVYEYADGAWPATPSEDLRFVYDGWNLLIELDGLNGNAVVRKYTWGLDLSGLNGDQSRDREGAVGLHKAGGIGGLLAAHDLGQSKDYMYLYDANGNVGQLLDGSDGTIAAKYEYDPYGNIIGPDADADGDWRDDAGPNAVANTYRFSTKYWDSESSLGYWGYRYYTPRLGRWMNRDPIDEKGGVNLYALVSNRPNTHVDPSGLMCLVSVCLLPVGSQPTT